MRKKIAKKVKRVLIHLTIAEKDYKKILKLKGDKSLAEFTRDLFTDKIPK